MHRFGHGVHLLEYRCGSGATVGSGFVSYTVAPQASPGDVQISFVSYGTSVYDAMGMPITLQTDDASGIIHINGGPAVPEPSSRLLASIGLGSFRVGWRLRR
jgi:hypothetical protein